MKISELSTDEAMGVLVQIVPYIENIVTDKALIDAFGKKVKMEEIQTAGQQFLVAVDKISSMIPVVMKTHKNDVYEILAALNSTTAEKIAKMNVLKSAALIRDAVKDKDLIDFFRSCVNGQEGG